MQPATRSSNQPLGGSSGGWRHRFLRFHLPLALASALVLVVFMTPPPFDVRDVGGHVDLTSGTFPQQRSAGQSGPMDQGGDQTEPMDHNGSQVGPMAHGTGQTGSMDHNRSQTGSTEHSRSQTGSMAHDAGQTGPIGPDEMPEMRDPQRLVASRSFTQRFTVATGYLATILLALTLLIGPANLLLRRCNPISSYLRRDVGMWTAIFSVAHVFFGLQVHDTLGNFLNYFFAPDGRVLTNSFGLGNWTGLAATAIVMGLLALSSDVALRKLKAGPWKWLQRLNYALFVLVIAHGFFYGVLLRTTSPFTFLFLLIVIAVLVGQALGIWLWRRRHARTTARPPA
jgi:methionine sulfoxide reductase heme-binding subunit